MPSAADTSESVLAPVSALADAAEPPEPTERLEARICELAGHLTAAACQFLLLVADFDARKGWAAWLSWKCQVAPGTARGFVLREVAPGITADDVRRATAAPLTIGSNVTEMPDRA